MVHILPDRLLRIVSLAPTVHPDRHSDNITARSTVISNSTPNDRTLAVVAKGSAYNDKTANDVQGPDVPREMVTASDGVITAKQWVGETGGFACTSSS